MKIILIAAVSLIALMSTGKVYAFDEYINDIPVPLEVSMRVQSEWGGYIIYSIKEEGGNYVATIARDGEPHQYPIRLITYTKSFDIIKDTGQISPKAEDKKEPKKDESKKEEKKPEPTVEPVRPEEPREIPRPTPRHEDPPIPEPTVEPTPTVKPPDPEPTLEPTPTPETTQ